jgi:NADPH-dependent 7-cyano-7-deazaguanine reductase QueF
MNLQVRVTAPIVHLCPFRDETDYGTVTLTYNPDDGEIEFHDLRTHLDEFAARRITHERLTAELHNYYPHADITTEWSTAGMGIECAVPRDSA